MRIIWDSTNSEWDLQAVYHDGTAIAVGAVMDGISLYTDCTVVWGMDSDNETDKLLFASYASYGAVSQGWGDTADISDIVFGP